MGQTRLRLVHFGLVYLSGISEVEFEPIPWVSTYRLRVAAKRPMKLELLSREISQLFACSIVTSGLTYSSVRSVFDKSGIVMPIKELLSTAFRGTFWRRGCQRSAIRFSMHVSRKPRAAKSVSLWTDVGARRSKPSRHGTVTCFDADSQEMLDVNMLVSICFLRASICQCR